MLSAVLFTACYANSSDVEVENKKVKRVVEIPADFHEQQRAYDEQRNRQEMEKWGQGEDKPFDQRYRDYEDPYTYQGNVK